MLNPVNDHECPVPPYKEQCFNDGEMSYLIAMYKLLYPNLNQIFHDFIGSIKMCN